MARSRNTITVNSATLSGIRKLIFAKNGLDLTNIINDLNIYQNDENADLLAINLAIVYAGVKPEITPVVYDHWGKNKISKYTCVNYSLIQGTVIYTEVAIEFNEETQQWVEKESNDNKHDCSLPRWEELYTTFEEAVKRN